MKTKQISIDIQSIANTLLLMLSLLLLLDVNAQGLEFHPMSTEQNSTITEAQKGHMQVSYDLNMDGPPIMKLRTIDGVQVNSAISSIVGTKRLLIDTNELPDGMYVLSVGSEFDSTSSRFIIER